MIIVCPNCKYEIISEVRTNIIDSCPMCGAPILGGLGVAWCG